ncbi:hypothetical protein MMC27_000350 [Xylographa pallens]|nr:hypothetical protein [Xylographa pallens]
MGKFFAPQKPPDDEGRRHACWPYIHGSKLRLLEKPPIGSLQVIDLSSDDEDDSDYVPDSEGSSSSSEESESDEEPEHDFVDSDPDAEVNDLQADSPSLPTPSETAVVERVRLEQDIIRLETAEAEAAATYNPAEVVALLTEFHELMMTMGHWPQGSIHRAPHDPPVNVELGKELGYEPQVLELMQKLPYLTRRLERHNNYIIPETRWANYRQEKDLREGRRPMVPHGDTHPNLDPWILPLAFPGWYGVVIYLDTHIGAIRSYTPYGGPPEDLVEWLRHGEYEEKDRGEWTHEYRRAPLITAREYLQTCICAYASLQRLPVIEAEDNDPEKVFDTESEKHGAMYRDAQTRQKALLDLYHECGWPDDWRRDEFLMKWEKINENLSLQTRERMKRNLKTGL